MTTNTTDEDRTPAQTLATAMRTAVAARRDLDVLDVLDKTAVYLAGPMTGYPEFNFPAFKAAASDIDEMGVGAVYCTAFGTPPAPEDALPWDEYLREALRLMLTCNAVVVLPGWRESKGARLEVYVALELGMPVVEYPDLRPVESIGINIPAPPDIDWDKAPTWDEIKPYLYPATQGGLAVIPEGAKYGTQTAEYIARRYGGVDPRTGHHIKPEGPSTVTIAGVEFDTTEDPEQ